MRRIEQRLQLVDQAQNAIVAVSAPDRQHLLTLAEQLFAPELTIEIRIEIASQIRSLLKGQEEWIPPPVLKAPETISL